MSKKVSLEAFKNTPGIDVPDIPTETAQEAPAISPSTLEIQTRTLCQQYGAVSFGVKDMMNILGVGEKKIRELKKAGRIIFMPGTNRVAAVELAKYMVGYS